MSVINRMLKDLEKRSASGDPSIYQPAAQSSSRWLVAGLTAAVVILLGAVGGMFWYQYSSKTVKEQVPSVQTAKAEDQSAAKAESMNATNTENKSIAAPESESEKTASADQNDVKDEELAALEDEIYGPDVPPAVETAYVEPKTQVQPQRTVEEKKPKVMRVQEVKLTKKQEIELDRKAVGTALSMGKIDEAKEALRSMLSRDPANTFAREKLAALLYGEGRLAEAKSVLNQGISGQPAYGNYRLLLARILVEENRKREALAILNAYSPKAAKENLDYLSMEASLATDLNEPLIAVESYSKLTRIMPKEGKWWFGLAIAFDRQGTASAAKANYRQALSLGLPEASHKFAQQRLSELGGRK